MDAIHENKKATYMNIIKNAIVSYFRKNEYELHVMYDPKNTHDNTIEEQSMTLSDVMEFLTTGKPSMTEKTVFLCKFHRGLDVSTLVDKFNYEVWEQLVKWFGTDIHDAWNLDKCPVPITLIQLKTNYKHVGFLDRDAIEQMQRYLDYRKTKTKGDMQKGMPLFLNKLNRPITSGWVFDKFDRIAKRSGIRKFAEFGVRKQYRVDSHELRDLLKSTLIDCGCRIDVADHVIGHKPKDSYEKQAILYPEGMRKEYGKASKRLNIFTKFSNTVSGNDDTDQLQLELREKISDMEKMSKQMAAAEAVKKQDTITESRFMELAKDMQKQINELKSGAVKQKPVLEFCCVDCSTVHSEQTCPNCNSKIKRVYKPSN